MKMIIAGRATSSRVGRAFKVRPTGRTLIKSTHKEGLVSGKVVVSRSIHTLETSARFVAFLQDFFFE